MDTIQKPSSVLELRSWLFDVRLVERLGPLPPDIQAESNVENNENNGAQKFGQNFEGRYFLPKAKLKQKKIILK